MRCVVCSIEIVDRRGGRKYCSNRCSCKARRLRNPRPNNLSRIRECIVCGMEFYPNSHTQKCCSRTCSKTYYKKFTKRWADANKEYRKHYYKKYYGTNRDRLRIWTQERNRRRRFENWELNGEQRHCAVCGSEFMALKSTQRVTCSRKCAQTYRSILSKSNVKYRVARYKKRASMALAVIKSLGIDIPAPPEVRSRGERHRVMASIALRALREIGVSPTTQVGE